MKGSWTYEDFLDQLRTIRKLGPLQQVLRMIPGMQPFVEQVQGDELDVAEKILDAMTPNELTITELMDPKRGPERRRRIAARAGVEEVKVQQFVKTFAAMERVVEQLTRRGPK